MPQTGWLIAGIVTSLVIAVTLYKARRDDAEYEKHRELQKRWR